MPGDNFSRRVARAAAAGGGRTYRAQTPVSWYLILLVICLLGVSLVTYSRYEHLHPLPSVAAKQTPPTATNLWEAAVVVDHCGTLIPSALPEEPVVDEPIASLGNGVIRIDPGLSPEAAQFEGAHATLGAYLELESAQITALIASFPGPLVKVPATTTTTSSTTTTTLAKSKKSATTTSTTTAKSKSTSTSTSSTSSTTTSTTLATKPGPARVYKNGQTCEGKPGVLSVETWPTPTSTKGTSVPSSSASQIHLENGEMITIAFLPKGAVIPRPPAAARNAVAAFMVEDPTGFATTTIPSTIATSSTSATSSTTTVPGKATSTTTAGTSTTSSTTAANGSTSSSTTSPSPASSSP